MQVPSLDLNASVATLTVLGVHQIPARCPALGALGSVEAFLQIAFIRRMCEKFYRMLMVLGQKVSLPWLKLGFS